MQIDSKTRRCGLRVLLMVVFGTLFLMLFSVNAMAAKKNGFVTENGKTYYYENGVKHKGWLTLNGKKYYFTKGAGVMCTGWLTDSKGNKRYFDKTTGVMATGWVAYSNDDRRYFATNTGVMARGWLKASNNRYYMDTNTGFAKKGFQKIGSYYRYFYSRSGALARGWLTNSMGERRYFATASSNKKDGAMATGLSQVDGKRYFFKTSNGKMVRGWKTVSGKRYYFTNDGSAATGTVTIEGKKYTFSDKGVLQNTESTSEGGSGSPSNAKTIKNYLLGALQPVGKVLYVWGGGWNNSNTIGIPQAMLDWYASQSSNYNYANYDDLSVANRAKGFDCSGFVGWATYQVMHNRTGEHEGYTVVSGDVGSYYKSLGWGTTINQNYLSSNGYTLKAGDIGYNSGHVWIVIGQCRDKSVVLVHSSNNAGVQIAGTPTPNGGYSSQAITLATQYMRRYSGTSKYHYNNSTGNYIPQYNYFRWNRDTLADPDGYMKMYADEILADLFS